jgi:hypothetical protein
MQFCFFFILSVWPAVWVRASNQHIQNLETLPVISFSLAPPTKPHNEIASEIARLEATHDVVEHELYDLLEVAFNASLTRAQRDLPHVVKKHMLSLKRVSTSGFLMKQHFDRHAPVFFETNQLTAESEIKVNVVGTKQVSKDVISKMRQLDKKLSVDERNMFQQACREFDWLTDIVKQYLVVELAEATNVLLRSSRHHSNGKALRAASLASLWSSAQVSGSSNVLHSAGANVRVAPSAKKMAKG